MNASIFVCLALVVIGMPISGAAETIYRCGNGYSAVPCAGATMLAVDAGIPTSRRVEAEAVMLREKRLAAEMARERRLDEAAIRPALATSLGPAKAAPTPLPPHVAKKPARKRSKASAPIADSDRDFIARVPKTPKASS